MRPTTQMTNASGSRIQSVDALRGAIMVLMALDHVRDYTSYAAMHFNPVDLSRTTAVIFFTRWVTHFCAPVFALSAGIGAFFWYQHGRSKSQLSRFLITRGLWLMFLEFTVVRFLYFFQVQWRGSFVILTVFWMLGLSMIVSCGPRAFANEDSGGVERAGDRRPQPPRPCFRDKFWAARTAVERFAPTQRFSGSRWKCPRRLYAGALVCCDVRGLLLWPDFVVGSAAPPVIFDSSGPRTLGCVRAAASVESLRRPDAVVAPADHTVHVSLVSERH